MSKCELCGDRFNPSNNNTFEQRYCRTCRTDNYRGMIIKVHEIIGNPNHVWELINGLKSQLIETEKKIGDLKRLIAKEGDGLEIASSREAIRCEMMDLLLKNEITFKTVLQDVRQALEPFNTDPHDPDNLCDICIKIDKVIGK